MGENSPKIVYDERNKKLIFEWDVDKEVWIKFQGKLLNFFEEQNLRYLTGREYDKDHERKIIFSFRSKEETLKLKSYLDSLFQIVSK